MWSKESALLGLGRHDALSVWGEESALLGHRGASMALDRVAAQGRKGLAHCHLLVLRAGDSSAVHSWDPTSQAHTPGLLGRCAAFPAPSLEDR